VIVVTVLGIEWDRKSDNLIFDFRGFIKKSEDGIMTKRKILSLSASIYDPLGMISPITSQIKTLFQSLCVDKSDWDEVVSGNVRVRWFDLLEKIKVLEIVNIPRFALVDFKDVLSVELHGFSDSSLSLYCAVVYVRIIAKTGKKVFFWTSKTRVAPLKAVSIPRLELLGCLLLSELIQDVKRAIAGRLEIDLIRCWTDSTVALCWIKGKEKTWKAWVENRVLKIRKAVPRDLWFHVAGTENPADKPTRTVDDFVSLFSGIWFTGPSFLLDDEICYNDTDDYLTVDAKHELKKTHELQTITTTVQNDKVVDLNEIVNFTRYSCMSTLVNVIAYILRFKKNILAKLRKTNTLEGDLTIEEAINALEEIIRYEQNHRKLNRTC